MSSPGSPTSVFPPGEVTSEFHRVLSQLFPRDPDTVESVFVHLRTYSEDRDLVQLVARLSELVRNPKSLSLFDIVKPLIPVCQQVAYEQLTPYRSNLRKIVIKKDPQTGFGFHVRGGDEFDTGVFVSHVQPGSPAEKSLLFSGDRIINCNNFNISSSSLFDFCKFIQLHSIIVLQVVNNSILPFLPDPDLPLSWLMTENNNRSRTIPIFNCKVYLNDGFGCSLMKQQGKSGIYADSVVPFSVAHELGIREGDQILYVNGVKFRDISKTDAVVAFKKSSPVSITFQKNSIGVNLPPFSAPKCPIVIRSALEGNESDAIENFKREMASEHSQNGPLQLTESFIKQNGDSHMENFLNGNRSSTEGFLLQNREFEVEDVIRKMDFSPEMENRGSPSKSSTDGDFVLKEHRKNSVSEQIQQYEHLAPAKIKTETNKIIRRPSKLVIDAIAKLETQSVYSNQNGLSPGLTNSAESTSPITPLPPPEERKLVRKTDVIRRNKPVKPIFPNKDSPTRHVNGHPNNLDVHPINITPPAKNTMIRRMPSRGDSFTTPSHVAIRSKQQDKLRHVSVTCTGYLGISLEGGAGFVDQDILITCVEDESPLKSCVSPGDRLISVDGIHVTGMSLAQLNDTIRMVELSKNGSAIELVVEPNDAKQPITEETTYL